MVAAVALIAAATALAPLPPLPDRGLALETTAGVELQTMRGRPLATLRGLDLAPDAFGHGLILRDRRGRLFALDRQRRRLIRFFRPPADPPGCRLTDGRLGVVDLVVCGRTIKKIWADGKVRVVARPPGKVGHWVRAAWAPRGGAFFAQWSAECEIPVAYFIAGGKMRPYGGRTVESVALGWLPGGDAVVHFPKAGCGSGHRQPGIYAVPRTGKPRLLLRTPKFERYWMWGG